MKLRIQGDIAIVHETDGRLPKTAAKVPKKLGVEINATVLFVTRDCARYHIDRINS